MNSQPTSAGPVSDRPVSAGPLSAPAEVLEYDELWPAWFERIRARLEPYLGDLPHQIEHVGSTAVPGLAAKPIIDIDVVVPTVEQFPSAIAALVAAATSKRVIWASPAASLSSTCGRAALPPLVHRGRGQQRRTRTTSYCVITGAGSR